MSNEIMIWAFWPSYIEANRCTGNAIRKSTNSNPVSWN